VPARVVRRALPAVLALVLGACATAPVAVPEPPGLAEGIYRASDGAQLSKDELVDEWARIPGDGPLFIYIAESHDNAAHHAVQAEVLEALMRRFPARTALGMEMFPTPLQPVLDSFSGGAFDSKELAKRTDWEKIWGFDYELYVPMLELIALQGAPLVALNAPKALTRKLAKVGPEGLSDEERAALPSTFDLASAEHRAMITEVLMSVHEMDEATFERFYAAQRAWDSTMAASAVRFVKGHPEIKVLVVIAGGYHLYGGLGIPRHVDAAMGAPVRRVILIPVDTEDRRFGAEDLSGEDGGDYYWLSRGPTDESHP
jgi:uncharacterized iron-regulated protein